MRIFLKLPPKSYIFRTHSIDSISLMSAPAANAFSLPVTTMHPTESSRSQCSNAATSAEMTELCQKPSCKLSHHISPLTHQICDEGARQRVQRLRSVQRDEGHSAVRPSLLELRYGSSEFGISLPCPSFFPPRVSKEWLTLT